jgi:exopolysaccharide production protein ExoQ
MAQASTPWEIAPTGRRALERVEEIAGWLIAAATLFVAVWRVLLWQLLDPWLNAVVTRVGHLLGYPNPVIRFDFTAITLTTSWVLLVAVVLLFALRDNTFRRKEFWLLSAPLLIYLAVAGASRYWSVLPGTTIKRVWYLCAVTFGGVFIGMRFRQSKIVLFWELASTLLVLGSYALIFRHPEVAIDTEYDPAGAWRGLLKYKGYAGSYMALATTVFLLKLFQGRRISRWRQLVSLGLAALSLVMVYRAMSATGQIALLAAMITFGLGGAWIRWGHLIPPRTRKALIVVGVCLVLIALAGSPLLIRLVGRDVTLTGRLPLWGVILGVVRERPALGWGFGEAFWLSDNVGRVWQTIIWRPGTAHSGLVEVLLDTGVVGAVAMGLYLATTLVLGLANVRHERSPEALLFLAWLPLVLVANVGENLLGTYELVFWLVLAIVFSHTARSAIERRPGGGTGVAPS